MDFWKEKYLEHYLAMGGSKIKFVTGRTGSGKTHFLLRSFLNVDDSDEKYLLMSDLEGDFINAELG